MVVILHALGILFIFSHIEIILLFFQFVLSEKLLSSLRQKLSLKMRLILIVIGQEIFQLENYPVQLLLSLGLKKHIFPLLGPYNNIKPQYSQEKLHLKALST